MNLSADELHILVSWAYAIRDLDGERFTAAEQFLLDKLIEARRQT